MIRETGLVDSHLHIQSYVPAVDVRSIVDQAESAGVSHLVCNGTLEGDWNRVIEMADGDSRIIPFVGLHPWFTRERSSRWLDALEDIVRSTNCGIGEIGLDKCAKQFNPSDQEEVFRSQLELARKYNRPVTIHCVHAWGWLMDILGNEGDLPTGMLMHSYGGSVDLIKPLAKMGAYFSFSGKVLQPSFGKAREALMAVPEDRLLLETDAPFILPPEPFRPQTVISSEGEAQNHPANLPAIVDGVADLLDVPAESLRERLSENAKRFFGDRLR